MTVSELNEKANKHVMLPPGYKPTESEKYMCLEHLEYFRKKLLDWKN